MLAVLSLVVCASAAARATGGGGHAVGAGGHAVGAGGVPPFPRIPGQWWHLEMNIKVKRQPHTLTLDRGRIVQVSATQVTLRESDGSTPVIPINQQTIVTIAGRRATIADLLPRMQADTMQIDDGPAVRLRATFASR